MGSTRRKDLLGRLAAGAALLLVAGYPLRDALLHARVLFWRDVHFSWLPLTEVFARGIHDGELPLWDRFSGFGRPFLADARSALLYPPTWLSLALPRADAYALFSYLHLVWAGAGVLALARRLGAGFLPALAAGLAFAASGPLLSLVIMWHQLAGAAWIPWALLAADRAARAARPGPVVAAAVALALPLLAGSPESALVCALAWPFLALARGSPAARRGAVVRLACALGLGVAFSAPQALPTLLRGRESSRTLHPEAAALWSLHPARLAEAALPLSATQLPLRADASQALLDGREPLLHSLYLGAGVVSLAFVGFVAGGRLGRCLGALGALFAGLAFGKHAFFQEWAAAVVPPLGLIRYPQKLMVGVALVACLLAALGVTAIAAARAEARRVAFSALAVALLIGACALPSLTEGWLAGTPGARQAAHHMVADAATRAGLLAAVPAAVAIVAPAAAAWTAPVLGLLLVLPALAYHGDLLWAAPAGFFEERPPVLRHLEVSEAWRLYAYDYTIGDDWQSLTTPTLGQAMALRADHGGGSAESAVLGAHQALHPPTAARWGLAGSFDYDPLDLDRQDLKDACRLLRAKEAVPDHTRLLRLGAVRYAVALAPGTWWNGLRLVAREPGRLRLPVSLLEVPGSLPRAYAVYASRPAADAPLALREAIRPDFDPRGEVVLVGPERGSRDRGAGFAPVEVAELRANRVRLAVSLTRDGFVVLVDAWDAGWSARVDGAPAPLLVANGLFRAVPVTAGRHVVEMRYWPPGLTLGLCCAAGAALVSSILLASRRRA